MMSEDWYFSRLLRKAGAKMRMFCDLTTIHYGGVGWWLKDGIAGMCANATSWKLPLQPLPKVKEGEGKTYGSQRADGSIPPKMKDDKTT